MGNIYIGTSGYSYSDWKGVFYPEDLKQQQFLPYYTDYFSFTELNFSYYRMPDPQMLARIADKTPEDFRFSIKAYQSITHDRGADWRKDAETFREAVLPLVESQKIGAIVLQFPYSFHYTPPNRHYLSQLSRCLEGLPLAVEFRNTEWQREDAYEGMRLRNLGYVITDAPDLPGLPQPITITTSDIGYLRFHGRNKDNWWKGDSTTRYDYLYSEDELSQWISRIAELIQNTSILFIAFNNHYKGQAAKNGLQLISLLKSHGIEGT